MKRNFFTGFTAPIVMGLALFILSAFGAGAQNSDLIGYFQNWHTASTPYIQLDQVDARYTIVNAAFAVPKSGTDYNMQYIPEMVSQGVFISKVAALQAQGRKVLISLGGGNAPVKLDTEQERDIFISSVTGILNTFGFDGIDIDFEGSSLTVTGGSIGNPVDQPVNNLIQAIRQIMANYRTAHNKRMLLTMAPETAFVQGGQSAYGGVWGAYLPVIHALRDSLEVIHVQLYNSGSMYGIDGKIYTQGTADFIVAMGEAMIQGFHTAGGFFEGLPPEKVAIALPACPNAAGGGFANTNIVKAALNYLLGKGQRPGNYVLANASGYPDLRGMMTWSINWDAVASCGGVYEFAQNYQEIFGEASGIDPSQAVKGEFAVYPNPASDFLVIEHHRDDYQPIVFMLFNAIGQLVISEQLSHPSQTVSVGFLPKGVYAFHIGNFNGKVVLQ
ncbi:MAG: T9SS type A sorting domain-containing protein [Bacteroidales bacterium]|nr:T9SS type A sorting domain-containing protein [Bacteroidales bacterium]